MSDLHMSPSRAASTTAIESTGKRKARRVADPLRPPRALLPPRPLLCGHAVTCTPRRLQWQRSRSWKALTNPLTLRLNNPSPKRDGYLLIPNYLEIMTLSLSPVRQDHGLAHVNTWIAFLVFGSAGLARTHRNVRANARTTVDCRQCENFEIDSLFICESLMRNK